MDNIKNNTALRTVKVWVIITVAAFLCIFLPSLLGIDGFQGGYAISFISFFMVIVGLIVIIIYSVRAREVGRIMKNIDVLAHWTYEPAEWNAYAEKQYQVEKKQKKVLFWIVAGWALFFGILFLVINPENGIWVFVLMLLLIAVIAFTAWFTAWHNYNQNKKSLGETFIAEQAVYINGQLHTWNNLGARLESAALDTIKGQTILILDYSTITRVGIESHTVRVPVPRGKEEQAEKIALRFQTKGDEPR
jgi:uncharacterized RDD family membrane protein YckC